MENQKTESKKAGADKKRNNRQGNGRKSDKMLNSAQIMLKNNFANRPDVLGRIQGDIQRHAGAAFFDFNRLAVIEIKVFDVFSFIFQINRRKIEFRLDDGKIIAARFSQPEIAAEPVSDPRLNQLIGVFLIKTDKGQT